MSHIEWQIQGYALYVIAVDAHQVASMKLDEARSAGSAELVIGWEISDKRGTRAYRPVTVHGTTLDPNEHVLAYGATPADARASWEDKVQGLGQTAS